jgi:hypothetical protein
MKLSGRRLIAVSLVRLALCIFIACFLCTVSVCQASQAEQHRGQDQPSSGGPDPGRFFFGTSKDAKLGTLGWLLSIDRQHHTGQIFVAPRMIGFSEFNLGEDGTLRFQSLDFFGKNYRFSGILKSDEITGEIQLVDAKSGNPKDKWKLTATQLPAQNPRANQPVPLGRYSNVDYSSEGGDFTGVDIRLFSVGTGTTGLIVFYESYWGEPTLTPLALSQIEMSKGTIQFETETPNGVVHYHLRLTATGGLFSRDDVAHEKGEKAIVLKKRGSVLTAAAGKRM